MKDVFEYNTDDEVKFVGEYKLLIKKTVTSTNEVLKEEVKKSLLKGESCKKIALIADGQTKGRGRLGRSFYSPSGTGLYLSCVLPIEGNIGYPISLTAAAGVAVCRSIEKVLGISPKIKWVNDLYLGDKKICGILAEAVNDPESGKIAAIVIGIGINCTTENFPKELENAGSLCCGEINFPRVKLAENILNEIDKVFTDDFIEEYKRRSNVLGRKIYVIDSKTATKKAAYAKGIDKNGGLVVQYEKDGINKDVVEETLTTGEITVRFN